MKFSIIIATYNSEALLERALLSVLNQSYPHVEVIVQDGASTDETIDILKRCGSRVNWRSEPDTGVYDAWNKALDRASGDWALFLGSDDLLLDKDILVRCVRHLKRLPPHILFAYGAMVSGTNGQVTELVNRSLMEVYRRFAANMAICFPATFVRLAAAKQGKFDPSYKIAGDFDFVARYLRSDNIARLPLIVSYMERGGLSTNPVTNCLMMDERGTVLYKHILPKAQELVIGCMQHYWHEDSSLEAQ